MIIHVFEEIVFNGQQSREYNWIAEITKGSKRHKVKITIDRDAIDFQCSAYGWVWNDNELKWVIVYDIPYTLMETLKTVYSSGKEDASAFQADKVLIEERLKQILF